MTAGDVDYYALDELLDDEARMTRASVRSFVEREALPFRELKRVRQVLKQRGSENEVLPVLPSA